MCRLPWGHEGAHQGVCTFCTTPRDLRDAQRRAGDYSKRPRSKFFKKKEEKGDEWSWYDEMRYNELKYKRSQK